ncbi:MAG TPA: DUF2235 domain-containing protein [Beijerinckiaceae bacterium]|jgi:uncharacterized protein (DUF2235 family)
MALGETPGTHPPSSEVSRPKPPPRKLIVCCDGTWNKRDSIDEVTNVAKMARVISPIDDSGISQLIYYHPGVGTGNWWDKIAGGGLGEGLSANVQGAYAFLVDNFQPGDFIYLFGFSRGAYTARSLAGLIGLVGLLSKADMDIFPQVYAIYRSIEHREKLVRGTEEDARTAIRALFPDSDVDKLAKRLLKALDWNTRRTQIFFIGVWDTVGSLGVPDWPFKFGAKEYAFHDTEISNRIVYAYHALAIDESRGPFRPTLWTRKKDRGPDPKPQVLEQVWFAGCHSNVGGGYPDCGLSDIAFLWMASKAASAARDANDRPLAFNEAYLREIVGRGKGALIESRTGPLWKLMPAYVRKVMETPAKDQKTGADMETCERIHESVVLRFRGKEADGFVPFPYAPANAKSFLAGSDRSIIAELSEFEKSYRPKDVLPPAAPAPVT